MERVERKVKTLRISSALLLVSGSGGYERRTYRLVEGVFGWPYLPLQAEC